VEDIRSAPLYEQVLKVVKNIPKASFAFVSAITKEATFRTIVHIIVVKIIIKASFAFVCAIAKEAVFRTIVHIFSKYHVFELPLKLKVLYLLDNNKTFHELVRWV